MQLFMNTTFLSLPLAPVLVFLLSVICTVLPDPTTFFFFTSFFFFIFCNRYLPSSLQSVAICPLCLFVVIIVLSLILPLINFRAFMFHFDIYNMLSACFCFYLFFLESSCIFEYFLFLHVFLFCLFCVFFSQSAFFLLTFRFYVL